MFRFDKKTAVVGIHFCTKANSASAVTGMVFGHSDLHFSFFLNFSLGFDELAAAGPFLLPCVQVICISQRECWKGKDCQARC